MLVSIHGASVAVKIHQLSLLCLSCNSNYNNIVIYVCMIIVSIVIRALAEHRLPPRQIRSGSGVHSWTPDLDVFLNLTTTSLFTDVSVIKFL